MDLNYDRLTIEGSSFEKLYTVQSVYEDKFLKRIDLLDQSSLKLSRPNKNVVIEVLNYRMYEFLNLKKTFKMGTRSELRKTMQM